MNTKNTFMEFFAGGGMARLGLSDSWRCLYANDIDSQKCDSYRINFGDDIIQSDVGLINPATLPKTTADLIWGSFPCQDLSLAGARGGIKAQRSSAFFQFWRLIDALCEKGQAPRLIALENVIGLLTSNGGRDFQVICKCLASAGYRISALILDAKLFTPQSRPRLFILGFSHDLAPEEANSAQPETAPPALLSAYETLSPALKKQWLWLSPSPKTRRNRRLTDIIDWDAPYWHDKKKTNQLLALMNEKQRARVEAIAKHGARRAGAAFRRTRLENGKTAQRLEARFDGLAGCLRTPAGGSSRQIIIAIDKGVVRTRLISPREAARLMGLPEDYILPKSDTAALKLCGDGVCVPVVQWLSENILEPALTCNKTIVAA